MKIIFNVMLYSISIFLSVASCAYSTPVQWTQGTGSNGNWYEIIDNGSYLTWNTANSYATTSQHNEITGHLATITSAEENMWVYQNLIQPLMTGSYSILGWLGGTIAYGGNWEWVTGEPWSYENWYPGEPNNLPTQPSDIDAVTFVNRNISQVIITQEKLADAPIDWYIPSLIISYYIVEFEDNLPAAIPEPATLLLLGLSIAGIRHRIRS